MASHKTEGPATTIVFLGILIDTHTFELQLPTDKLARIRVLLQSWSGRRSCTRKELESPVPCGNGSYTGAYLPEAAIRVARHGQGTFPPHPPQCWGKGRPAVVENLSSRLEWHLFFPGGDSLLRRRVGRIWILQLRCILAHSRLVPAGMARELAICLNCSKRASANCPCSESVGPRVEA